MESHTALKFFAFLYSFDDGSSEYKVVNFPTPEAAKMEAENLMACRPGITSIDVFRLVGTAYRVKTVAWK